MLTSLVVILMFSLFGSYFLPLALLTRAIGDETTLREIFEEYVTRLQEKAKEKERRREEEKVIVHSLYLIVIKLLYFRTFSKCHVDTCQVLE